MKALDSIPYFYSPTWWTVNPGLNRVGFRVSRCEIVVVGIGELN